MIYFWGKRNEISCADYDGGDFDYAAIEMTLVNVNIFAHLKK